MRDTLTKPDAPDIRFELHRVSATEFAVIEERRVCISYCGLAPPRPGALALTYGGAYLGISDGFEACIAKRYRIAPPEILRLHPIENEFGDGLTIRR